MLLTALWAGRITRANSENLGNNSGADWSYAYDDLDRLQTATNATAGSESRAFTYGNNNNMTRNTALGSGTAADITYGAVVGSRTLPHAVKRIGPNASGDFTYDQNGNVVTGLGRTIAWDGENRPASVARTGFLTTEYWYGPDGERVRKKVGAGSTLVNTYSLGPDLEIVPTGTAAGDPAGPGERCFDVAVAAGLGRPKRRRRRLTRPRRSRRRGRCSTGTFRPASPAPAR